VQAGINLFSPRTFRFRAWGRTLISVMAAVLVYVSLKAGAWVALADKAEDTPHNQWIITTLNASIRVGHLMTLVGILSILLLAGWLHRPRDGAS
jgi:hypothetical protein